MTTITDELIEKVARRMCELQGLDVCVSLHDLRDKLPAARDAIAAHISIAEIMPPNRATLLAVADAAKEVARNELHLGRPQGAWLKFAVALRAKAGGGE